MGRDFSDICQILSCAKHYVLLDRLVKCEHKLPY
jgi:hypothetical protein